MEFRNILQKMGELPFLEQEATHNAMQYHQEEFGKRFPPASIKTYQMVFGALKELGYYAKGRDILEIGTGFNLGVLFLAGLAGARKVTGLDAYTHEMGPVHDFILSVLNHLAKNPKILLTLPDESTDLFERFAGMISKDHNGHYIYNPDRLEFRFPYGVESLPFADSSFDLIYTSAVFEHFMDPETAVREIARVTRPRGVSFHIVDLRDHRNLANPLEFLKMSAPEWETFCRIAPAYSHTNRLRDSDIILLFARNGFSLIKEQPYLDIEVSDEMRNAFVDPFRSLSNEELGILGRFYCFRKLGAQPLSAIPENSLSISGT